MPDIIDQFESRSVEDRLGCGGVPLIGVEEVMHYPTSELIISKGLAG